MFYWPLLRERENKRSLRLFNYLLCLGTAQRTKATMVSVVKWISLCLWEQFLQQASEIMFATANISPVNMLLIQRTSLWPNSGTLCTIWEVLRTLALITTSQVYSIFLKWHNYTYIFRGRGQHVIPYCSSCLCSTSYLNSVSFLFWIYYSKVLLNKKRSQRYLES